MSKITIDLPELNYKDIPRFKIVTRSKILDAIDLEVANTLEHFKLSGWDLSFTELKEDVIQRLLNFDIGLALMQKLLENDEVIIEADKGIKVKSKNGYNPVYYNAVDDELIVADSNTHLDDFTFNNGYVFLGGL